MMALHLDYCLAPQKVRMMVFYLASPMDHSEILYDHGNFVSTVAHIQCSYWHTIVVQM